LLTPPVAVACFCTIPNDLLEKPESAWPSLKNGNFAKTVTSGFVKKKTTIRSISVVRPSVNANPLTPPTAKK